jgi:hypothetical protein
MKMRRAFSLGCRILAVLTIGRRWLIPNPAGRYSVSMNSVARGENGRFVVTLDQTQITKHWIPVANGRFDLSIRLYNPAAEVTADPARVPLPVIHRISCT